MTARSRRRWVALLIFTATLALAAWWIDRQLEPDRLTTTVLGRLGDSLQLDVSYSGNPDYALKPEPRLLLPGLVVRDRRNGQLILSADRAEISLPWATITGGDPVITRIELDRPELQLPALRDWQVQRPKTPFRLPTLSDGLHVKNGTVREGDRYSISAIELRLPHLRSGDPAKATVAGVFDRADTRVGFQAEIAASTPGLESDFEATGSGKFERSEPLAAKMDTPLPFQFALTGAYRFVDSAQTDFSLDVRSLRLDGASPLPRLNGKSKLHLGEKMQLSFDGLLREWPKDWPALPEPLASDTAAMPLRLDYLGVSDLSGPLRLQLSRSDSRLQANLRIDEVRAWISHPDGSPLPPLTGTLSAPKLAIDGIELEGVEIEVRGD